MKAGPALAQWLVDPAAQAATAARNRSFADEARRTGPLATLAGVLDGLAREDANAGAIALAALRRVFEDVGWIAALIRAATDAAAADPFFEPPFAALGAGSRAGLVLLDHPHAILTLSMTAPAALEEAKRAPGRRSIGFSGMRSLTRFLGPGAARLAFYVAADAADDFRADGAPACRRHGRRLVPDDEIVSVDGRCESFVIEAVSAPVLMLAGEVRVQAGALAREYDAATLAFVGASSVDEARSRVQLMLTLLRSMRRTDAGDLFARTIAEGPFFLRWQAMREYLALDPRGALPVLATMADDDPHPEVRAAAQRILAVLRVRHPALFEMPPRGLAA